MGYDILTDLALSNQQAYQAALHEGIRIGKREQAAAVAELCGVLQRYLDHFGDPLQCARAVLAKHLRSAAAQESR